jgi:hypothetical protein
VKVQEIENSRKFLQVSLKEAQEISQKKEEELIEITKKNILLETQVEKKNF